jgi:hypothetical protein
MRLSKRSKVTSRLEEQQVKLEGRRILLTRTTTLTQGLDRALCGRSFSLFRTEVTGGP